MLGRNHMPKHTQSHIVIIGAANADITGISTKPLNFNESNPGKLIMGAGGVARNIGDNLSRLLADDNRTVYLLSAIGDDFQGKLVADESQAAGLDLTHCQTLTARPTASYFCVIDSNGEMRTAINDMSIVEQINTEYLTKNAELINSAELILLDANLTQAAINYICQNFNHIPIFADPVSAAKAKKISPNIQHLHCLTPNLNEAEILSGITARNDHDLANIAHFFHHKGIKNLFITLGAKGLYASSIVDDILSAEYLPALQSEIINANGAGDALMAGLIYAHINKMPMQQQANFAQACACLNTQSKHTINRQMTLEKISTLLDK